MITIKTSTKNDDKKLTKRCRCKTIKFKYKYFLNKKCQLI